MTTTAADASESMLTLEWFDPNEVTIADNIRTDPDLDADFLESVRADGIQEPVSAIRAGGEVQIIRGQRRTLAARETGRRLPAIVITDGRAADLRDRTGMREAVDRIFTQWTENERRKPLTEADKVAAVAALFEYGAKATAISKRTRLRPAQVRAAQRIAASEAATAALAAHPLSLDDAVLIAEFDGDPVRQKTILNNAESPGAMRRVAERFRDDDEAAARLADAAKPYEAAGYAVLAEALDWRYGLENLTGPDDAEVTEETHAACPGRAVFLSWRFGYYQRGQDPQAIFYCTDPAGNGHGTHHALSADPGADAAAEAKDAKAAAEKIYNTWIRSGNKDWRAAAKVRQAWLRNLLAGSRLPDGALRYILAEFALGSSALSHEMQNAWKTGRDLIAELPEKEKGQYHHDAKRPIAELIGRVPEKRAQMIILCLILGAYEAAIEDPHTWQSYGTPPAGATNQRTWRTGYTDTSAEQRYLRQLAAWGHELSPVELLCTPEPQPDAETAGAAPDLGVSGAPVTATPDLGTSGAPVTATPDLGSPVTASATELGQDDPGADVGDGQ